MCITASVGRNGQNHREDVRTLQILLNLNLGSLVPLAPLSVDGGCGNGTIGAIEEFQRRVQKLPKPDGRVDANGKTLAALKAGMPAEFSDEKLRGIMIRATPGNIDRFFPALKTKMTEYQITTPLRMAHFLAQIAHETYDFTYTEEEASGEAYEGRADLGNTQPGDGKRFKGRGLIQLTGRKNYTAYGEAKGKDYLTDETARVISSDAATAVDVSCWFWQQNSLNTLADADNVMGVTLAVNGGYNGLDDRKAKLKRAKFFLVQ